MYLVFFVLTAHQSNRIYLNLKSNFKIGARVDPGQSYLILMTFDLAMKAGNCILPNFLNYCQESISFNLHLMKTNIIFINILLRKEEYWQHKSQKGIKVEHIFTLSHGLLNLKEIKHQNFLRFLQFFTLVNLLCPTRPPDET